MSNSSADKRSTAYKSVSNKMDGKAVVPGKTRKPRNPNSSFGEFGSGIRAREEDGKRNPGYKTKAAYGIKGEDTEDRGKRVGFDNEKKGWGVRRQKEEER